ncbi:MAG: RbsD/FucU family protein [Planctomycetaceae bacterium]|nr:RbsD/FucU family protein [Planctomycetaceae bacterium]
MLRSELIHPKISEVLARAGHTSKVLIADGNYPAATAIGPRAELVSLNLAPGLVTVSQVLKVLLAAVPIEAINTMGMPADDPYRLPHDPPIWDEYRTILKTAGVSIELQPISKWDFYEAVDSRDHVLTIQTGDQSLWANLLLTIGCRTAGA